MAIPLAVMAVGTGIQAYSAFRSSQDAAEAARQQAKIKKAQVKELYERMKIQTERIQARGEEFKARQTNEFAAGGVQLGAGATLVALEDTNMKISQEVSDLERETKFKASQIKMGAAVDMKMASNMETAGMLAAFGSVANGAASYYKNS